MTCYIENYSVANTINKLYIQSDLHSSYIHNFCHYKQDIIDELFYKYHILLFKDIFHPVLIQ